MANSHMNTFLNHSDNPHDHSTTPAPQLRTKSTEQQQRQHNTRTRNMPSSSTGETFIECQILSSFKTVFVRVWGLKLLKHAEAIVVFYADLLDVSTQELLQLYNRDPDHREALLQDVDRYKDSTNIWMVSCELENMAVTLEHYGHGHHMHVKDLRDAAQIFHKMSGLE